MTLAVETKAVVATLDPKGFEPVVRRAADEIYERIMASCEDYLRDNVEWNIGSHISMLECENQRMRTELYEVDRALGGNPLGHERRIARIGDLNTTSNRYHSMLWAVSQKHEGEERHETALRYIREREERALAAGSGTAETSETSAQCEASQSGHAVATPESPSS